MSGRFPRGRIGAAFGTGAAVIAVVAVTAIVVQLVLPGHRHGPGQGGAGTGQDHVVVRLPARPGSYLGAYTRGVPSSYAPLQAVADATGTHPDLALYYSGWREPFQLSFARQAAAHHAVPLIQMEPGRTSLTAIASGRYDDYLDSFAIAVASYGEQTGHAVIISFAHEPNGSWYPWGFRHQSPRAFVAAWRHIVTVFRAEGADNVTWLWTVNIIARQGGIPSPRRWWPGGSYVTWVGMDGYYRKRSWEFAPLFGPTIKAVRRLTLDPILIAETAAAPEAGKAAKIDDLFRGVHAYGLLGLVWFDVNKTRDWRLSGPGVVAAFRRGAATFTGVTP
jgi:mannan endo-1,4-beta-mannosidase